MRSRCAILLTLLVLLAPAANAAAPPGAPSSQFVIREGRKIAVHVIAGRGPAIVLDAGGGLDSSYWTDLAPQLAKLTGSEVITYDRAGFGGSDDAPGPWNVLAARDDLGAVLHALHATSDVVLVSHSLAGEVGLYLVKQHPSWFSGAVLVDANVPEFFSNLTIDAASQAYAPMIAAAKAAPPTAETRQLLEVSESFVPTSRAFHLQHWPASVPAIVIVSEDTPFKGTPLAPAWTQAHAEFAKAAPNRTLVIATHSSHDVVHDRPDLITKAVVDMVKMSRDRSPIPGAR